MAVHSQGNARSVLLVAMAAQLRKKLAILSLALYWPAFFILAHIPIPRVVREANLSDKSLHFMAYFTLVFLLWGAIRPYERVDWRRPAAWWILVGVVWYGAFDEWTQQFVAGRTMDAHDFLADLSGSVACLILLSVVRFWPALVAVAGLAVVVAAGCTRADLTDVLPITDQGLHGLAFGGFAAVWVLHVVRSGTADPSRLGPWLLRAISVPLGLVCLVKLMSTANNRAFTGPEVAASLAGALAVPILARPVIRWAQARRADAGERRAGENAC